MSQTTGTDKSASGSNPAVQHASMSQVKAIVRRKLSKREEHEHTGLNIYPMMDMMTILLVFMVMQFASSSAAIIRESEEMRLPFSISQEQLQEAVPVQLTRDAILVDNVRMVPLRQGRVDASNLQGGSTSMLIPALQRRLCEVRDRKKQIAQIDPNQPFGGEVQIIADRRTPYRTITQVLYTLGQCEFHELRFLVGGRPQTATR